MHDEDDPWWTALVGALRTKGSVEDREPHGLLVTVDGTLRPVEIVCTLREWDDMVSIMWGAGAVDQAAEHVRQLVLQQPADHRYLVYEQYELVACRTAELPPDPDFVRMQEQAAQHPDGRIPGGYWSPYRPRDDDTGSQG